MIFGGSVYRNFRLEGEVKAAPVLLVLALISCSCAGKNPDFCQIQTPGATTFVHSFGDSITAGAGADHFCNGYQALFTTTLGFNADDEGVSGSMFVQSTHDIMTWFVQVPESSVVSTNNYKEHTEDINTVLPAFNDVTNFGGDPTHLAQFQSELTAALVYTGSLGKMTLVGTTLYASDQMQREQIPNHTNANVDAYVAVIKTVVAQVAATGLPVYLVDTNAVYNPNTMSQSNIHPDNYGHAVLALAFEEAYQSHLQ